MGKGRSPGFSYHHYWHHCVGGLITAGGWWMSRLSVGPLWYNLKVYLCIGSIHSARQGWKSCFPTWPSLKLPSWGSLKYFVISWRGWKYRLPTWLLLVWVEVELQFFYGIWLERSGYYLKNFFLASSFLVHWLGRTGFCWDFFGPWPSVLLDGWFFFSSEMERQKENSRNSPQSCSLDSEVLSWSATFSLTFSYIFVFYIMSRAFSCI